ncbi:MAG TPA: shikimate kinase [Solirubrobacteraceae bacterium]|nr:shikimate kinase [Solirubrobacteraceae bacterium]
MGAGKSTVGQAVASALGWPYLDNDSELARITGRSARELADRGGSGVHADERIVAQQLFEHAPPLVASLAASTFDDPASLAQMQTAGRAVYLRVSLGVLRRRIAGTDRPWLDQSPEVLERLLEGRSQAFAEKAAATVDGESDLGVLVRTIVDLAAGWWPATTR